MPRRARIVEAGFVYHILNRAAGHTRLFDGPTCYRDFLHLVGECSEAVDMPILAYCAMPNHWHMLVRPRQNGDLSNFVHRLTLRHSHHWHRRTGTSGRGAVYQARYKSFAVQTDDHLLTVARYVERNPLRARMVSSAFDWPWSSAQSHAGQRRDAAPPVPLVKLPPFPVPLPANWEQWVDEPQTTAELESLRRHVKSGAPFGSDDWLEELAGKPVPKVPVPQFG